MNSCCDSETKCCGRKCGVIIAVVGAVLIFAALVWVTRKYTTPAPLGAERAAERAKALAELTAAETDALNTVGYVDAARGTVRLPIAEAMKLAEQQWKDPAKARADLIARVEKATAKLPEKPSQYE